MADTPVEDAVNRNAQALLQMNFSQLMMDITPDAMAKLATQGGMTPGAAMTPGAQLPKLERYEIVSREQEGDDHIYDVRFYGDQNFGVKARWREITGQWKLVDFEGYQV